MQAIEISAPQMEGLLFFFKRFQPFSSRKSDETYRWNIPLHKSFFSLLLFTFLTINRTVVPGCILFFF